MTTLQLHAHFHRNEHHFVDKVWDWIVRSQEQHSVRVSDFLDPRQAFIVQSLANYKGDVNVHLFGGYAEAERKRAVIAPEYRPINDEDARIAVLAVTSEDARFAELQHGDVLGALLGIGLKREKIGDIHLGEDYCHCLIGEEMAEFLRLHLHQVHRLRVQTEILPLHRLRTVPVSLELMQLTVASMRLDGIVSDVYRLSRTKVLDPIRNGKCRVNWKTEEDPGKPLKEGDVVSFQGFGRFRVVAVEGLTKKGRIRMTIGKYQ